MRHLRPLPAAVGPPATPPGTEGGPLAWFAIQEVIDHQVVWAVWTDGVCAVTGCWVRGPGCWSTWGAEFCSDDPPRRYQASLQAPPVAVLLTLIRACDQAAVMEADLGPTPPTSTPPSDTGGSFRAA
jgi:hypothetical protein